MKTQKSSLYAYLLIISILMLGIITSSCTTYKRNKCSAYSNTYKTNKQVSSTRTYPGW